MQSNLVGETMRQLTVKEPYCSKCQKHVKPTRYIVNYRCPLCGATFMASQVEQDVANQSAENDWVAHEVQ